MNISSIKIPTPFQLSMDDIGWIEGRVPYWDGFQPTRTGIPRRHTLADYIAVNEIGKAANMKICGMFVLGDWDRNGILKNIKCSTKYGENWKGSECIDVKEEEEIRDYLNSCDYLEMAVHALMHESWDENGEWIGCEFVPPKDFKKGNPGAPSPEWYVRSHLDGFMEIYNDWGFTQKLRAFTCPGHCHDAWKDGSYTKILKDYGIKFWQEPYITHPIMDNGVILNKMPGWIALWEAYDINPDKLMVYTEETAGIYCSHWPNFLRLDPDLNLENLEKWKNFFNRQSQVFGVIISRDVEFAHMQNVYKYGTEMTLEGDKIKIDCTKADAIVPNLKDVPLYVSIKKDTCPMICEGGLMTEFETKDEFVNYKIERTHGSVIYLTKAN